MENEKVSVNLAPAELGKIDVLVSQGLFTSRTDVIRAGIRRILEEHDAAVQRVALGSAVIGMAVYGRKQLEKAKTENKRLTMIVIGVFVFDDDVTPELAEATIHEIRIFGSVRGPKAVLARIAPRIKHGMGL